MNVRERVLEVIRQIDELASSKGLRAAQRRALMKCRRLLTPLLRLLTCNGRHAKAVDAKQVCEIVSKVCELLNAYFRRED